ncbi:hypothetical protein [Kineococcus sp. SYSU DK006]|uniref:hypothetical protein n=1 Tax=Kineococcus sp. SYSU DK006 TaxID=3383127 RepID=UPI003D7E47A9
MSTTALTLVPCEPALDAVRLPRPRRGAPPSRARSASRPLALVAGGARSARAGGGPAAARRRGGCEALAAPLATPVPDRRPLRLTRRGRLVVSCTAATLVTTAVVAVAGALGGAAADAQPVATPTVVTVLPGQTLSEIAADVSPHEDWREVATRIADVNDLPTMVVRAGQRLTLPARG